MINCQGQIYISEKDDSPVERYALTIFCEVLEAHWQEMYKLDDIQFGIEHRDGQKTSPNAVEFGIACIDRHADQLLVSPE